MFDSTSIAVTIFIVAYALIISEKVHRTIVGIFVAMLMIMFGILSQETAIHHIDFNTLGLLMGMMIIVNITAETGLFNFLAIWAAQKVKAQPMKLLLARVRAMLRRRNEFTPDILRCGNISLNQQSYALSCGNQTVVLPKLEYQLMELLMLNEGMYLSTEELLCRDFRPGDQAKPTPRHPCRSAGNGTLSGSTALWQSKK